MSRWLKKLLMPNDYCWDCYSKNMTIILRLLGFDYDVIDWELTQFKREHRELKIYSPVLGTLEANRILRKYKGC